jgi:hypothetical protein
MVVALVSNRFQRPTRKCLEVDPIPCLSHYVTGQKPGGGTTSHAKRAGGGRTQYLMIILKILRICNVNSKINLKITVELKMFSHFVKFR